jgi:hypothetical protein
MVGRALAVGAAVLAVAQLVPVDRTNPPVDAEVEAPPAVQSLLRRACYDCHSNRTVWPWYSHVAPVSWLVAHDVDEGREELNFSTWTYPPGRKRKKLKEVVEQLNEGEMPLWYYLLLHPEARLSTDERDLIVAWAQAEIAAPPP